VLGNLLSCSMAAYAFARLNFRGIPRSLSEAALIDGGGHVRIFFRIMLPLSTPALATTAIFTFIWTWNDLFSQLIFLADPDTNTVPVALRTFVDSTGEGSWGPLFAMSIVSLLPIFLIFLFGQKYLVKGIATTGLE
jgi:multiple sugar transport system permease protein